jgi:hypothetical protein
MPSKKNNIKFNVCENKDDDINKDNYRHSDHQYELICNNFKFVLKDPVVSSIRNFKYEDEFDLMYFYYYALAYEDKNYELSSLSPIKKKQYKDETGDKHPNFKPDWTLINDNWVVEFPAIPGLDKIIDMIIGLDIDDKGQITYFKDDDGNDTKDYEAVYSYSHIGMLYEDGFEIVKHHIHYEDDEFEPARDKYYYTFYVLLCKGSNLSSANNYCIRLDSLSEDDMKVIKLWVSEFMAYSKVCFDKSTNNFIQSDDDDMLEIKKYFEREYPEDLSNFSSIIVDIGIEYQLFEEFVSYCKARNEGTYNEETFKFNTWYGKNTREFLSNTKKPWQGYIELAEYIDEKMKA